MGEELERSESTEDYRAAFELTGVGKSELDPGTKRFTRVNAKFCELTGFTAEELLGKSFLEITHPDDRAGNDAAFEAVRSGSSPRYHLEKRYIRKDGTTVWVIVNAKVVREDDGTARKVLAVVQDISGRKQTEEALLEAQKQLTAYAQQLEQRVAERTAKLEESINALDAFCYGVAHDLRSPVRAIHGYTSMLHQQIGAQVDEGARDYLRRILAAAKRMDELIDGLLLYGRFSQLDIPAGPVSLDSVVRRVLEHLNHEIEMASAQIDVQWPLPTVWGHESTLEQVFANLISNALKFRKPETPVKVSLFSEERETTARVYVKDNGIGIASEHQDRIFRIFERLDSTSKYPGTGIGLAIVKKGVERLGGKVGVESVSGQGACFWLDLMKSSSAM